MNSGYPETISLEGEKLDFLKAHSALIDSLYDIQGNEGPLELRADFLFQGDESKWELFYDLFFPEEGAGKLFTIVGENIIVKNNRGGKEALRELMDYLMVEDPKTMMNFARGQARKHINIPLESIAQARIAKGKAVPSAPANNALLSNNNNTYSNYSNYNNNNRKNGPNLGFLPEEENVMEKMSLTNIRRFYPNRRRASNRRTRRQNRKSRKTRRARQNRK